MGGRSGRGRQRNVKRGLMDTDNGAGLTMGVGGGGVSNGERGGTTVTQQ